MTTKQQEFDELFSMFHDFEIITLTYIDNQIIMTIQIPWGELWDDLNYYIKLELSGCDYVHCDYTEPSNTFENLKKRPAERTYIEKYTEDTTIISEMGLEIQSHQLFKPNKYQFICNSSKDYANGDLTFTAVDYKIFNKEGVLIDLNQMRDWCNEWWSSLN